MKSYITAKRTSSTQTTRHRCRAATAGAAAPAFRDRTWALRRSIFPPALFLEAGRWRRMRRRPEIDLRRAETMFAEAAPGMRFALGGARPRGNRRYLWATTAEPAGRGTERPSSPGSPHLAEARSRCVVLLPRSRDRETARVHIVAPELAHTTRGARRLPNPNAATAASPRASIPPALELDP